MFEGFGDLGTSIEFSIDVIGAHLNERKYEGMQSRNQEKQKRRRGR